MKKILEPFNIHLEAFWPDNLQRVEKMIRTLAPQIIKKLYGITINITDKTSFPHPRTGEPMMGDTRFFRGKPYLIIVGKDPSPRVFYHEVAHAIGIEDETEATKFEKEKANEFEKKTRR
jgi:hypothetical protein